MERPSAAALPRLHPVAPAQQGAAEAARRMRDIHRLAARLEYAALPAGRRLPTRVKRPARLLRDAMRALGRHGDAVAAASGRGRARQLADLLRFGLLDGIRPASYYNFRLFEPAEAARRHLYLEHEEVGVLLPYVFGRLPAEDALLLHDRPALARHRILDEKRLFARHCRAHGLPAVPSLLELAPGEGDTVDATMIPEGGDLFLKLSDEGCGVGALLLRWTGEGDFADPSGARWSRADIAAEMRRRAAKHGVLLQRRLVSHPAIAAISGAGLSTMRLVTVRRPDGTIEPLLAVYRLSTGTMPIDSFRLGGVTAPIDLASGRLGAAMSRRSLAPLERHPDTGNPIAGAVVPHWERVIELVLRAHASFPGLPTAGWDVPVLADGPVLNEGNSCWCVELVQMPHRRPLGETIFPECFAAWAGLGRTA
jgi:hypothetical protein